MSPAGARGGAAHRRGGDAAVAQRQHSGDAGGAATVRPATFASSASRLSSTARPPCGAVQPAMIAQHTANPSTTTAATAASDRRARPPSIGDTSRWQGRHSLRICIFFPPERVHPDSFGVPRGPGDMLGWLTGRRDQPDAAPAVRASERVLVPRCSNVWRVARPCSNGESVESFGCEHLQACA